MQEKRINKEPWISVNEALPELVDKGYYREPMPVLATDGKQVFRAAYVGRHKISTKDLSFDGDTDFDEKTDTEYWPEGWYEWNETEETHWKLYQKITYWMPMPSLPGVV